MAVTNQERDEGIADRVRKAKGSAAASPFAAVWAQIAPMSAKGHWR